VQITQKGPEIIAQGLTHCKTVLYPCNGLKISLSINNQLKLTVDPIGAKKLPKMTAVYLQDLAMNIPHLNRFCHALVIWLKLFKAQIKSEIELHCLSLLTGISSL
jgi:hypothetical protein